MFAVSAEFVGQRGSCSGELEGRNEMRICCERVQLRILVAAIGKYVASMTRLVQDERREREWSGTIGL